MGLKSRERDYDSQVTEVETHTPGCKCLVEGSARHFWFTGWKLQKPPAQIWGWF